MAEVNVKSDDANANPDSKVMLEEHFLLHPRFQTNAKVVLKSATLTYESSREIVTLNFRDVIGCKIDEQIISGISESVVYLILYHYPHRRFKWLSSKTSRKKEMVIFGVNIHKEKIENRKVAEKWKTAIIGSLKGTNDIAPTKSKKILVLINPFSGQKKAMHIYRKIVEPIFQQASLEVEEKETERAGHAFCIGQQIDTEEYYGIVTCSGDGLLHEIINGLMSRDDWQKAIKIPLGVLPGGSSNALCSTINIVAGEPVLDNTALHSAYVITKHQLLPADLISMETSNGRHIYSFVSLEWAMISDVDIESERYRYLGSARFTVEFFKRLFKFHKYRGRLSFKPIGEPNLRKTGVAVPMKASEVNQEKNNFNTTKGPEDQNQNAKKSKEDHNENYTAESNVRQSEINKQVLDSFNINMPSLNEKVPSDWTVIEDDFVAFCATTIKHLSDEMYTAPHAELDDACINLVMFRGQASRTQITKAFLGMASGEYVNEEIAEVIPCSAFRLEPLTKEGIMAIDGEVIEYGPVQGTVLPSFVRFMGINNS